MGDQVAVASSIYNLAGDEDDRPQFLKSLILGGILQNVDSLGALISKGYMNGPGINLKRYIRWAKSDSEFQAKLGTTQSELQGYQALDYEIIKPEIPVTAPTFVDHVESARIGTADIAYWVMQYLAATPPVGDISGYSYRYNQILNEITIYFPNIGGGTLTTFTPTGYVNGAHYLYVKYITATNGSPGSITWGSQVTVPGFPSLTGWTFSPPEVLGTQTGTLGFKEVTQAYIGGIPVGPATTVETPKPGSISTHTNLYFKDVFKGKHPTQDAVYSEREWLETELTYQVSDWILYDTVITGSVPEYRTFKYKKIFEPVYKVRNGTAEVINIAWDSPQYYIYQEFSGNSVLDGLFTSASASGFGEYFPPIPFRYDNTAIGPEGISATEWWLEFDFQPNSSDHEIRIYGGPVKEDEALTLTFLAYDLGNPNKVKVTTSINPERLPLIFNSGNAKYRITILSPLTVGDWLPISNLEDTPEPANNINPGLEDLYPICKKAFRKAFGSKYLDIQKSILDNDSADKIDHAYAVFGVSLNVKENACRKYIYKFFKKIIDQAPLPTEAAENDFYARYDVANGAEAIWFGWANTFLPFGIEGFDPPDRGVYPPIPWQTLKIESVHTGLPWNLFDSTSNYRTEIKWAFMREEFGTGKPVSKPTAVRDEVWFETLDAPITDYHEPDENDPDGFNQKIALYWQYEDDAWKRIVITGLQHINYVYRDMKVKITATEALDQNSTFNKIAKLVGVDVEYVDTESPFIIPLEEIIYDEMGMVDRTQMATACCFLVFNSYEIDREEWYETTLFKVIAIVLIIALTVVLTVTSGPVGLGVGGKAAFGVLVGAGLSTTAALVVIGIGNALIALLLSWLLQKGATEVFGDKWGPLIGSIVTTLLTLGLSAGSLTEAINNLTRAEVLISLSSSVLTNYLQIQTQETLESMKSMLEQYSKKTEYLENLSDKEFGNHTGIDLSLVSQYISELTENPDLFLQRTLMTGSDIVEITLDSINNFSKNNLKLELP